MKFLNRGCFFSSQFFSSSLFRTGHWGKFLKRGMIFHMTAHHHGSVSSLSLKLDQCGNFTCNALCRSWKNLSKVVNFDKSFLSAFLHWRRKISHRDIWTPQESKEKFRIENWRRREAKKYKKPVRGVCSSQDWSQKNPLAKRNLFYKSDVLSKHPEMAKKCIQSLKKMIFC